MGHRAESWLRKKWGKKRLAANGGKKGTGLMTQPQNSAWICHNNKAKEAHLQALSGLAHSPFERATRILLFKQLCEGI